MQNPVGYAIENGRAVMKDFGALVTNPNLPYQFLHVLGAGITTAGFVVLGFSAWHLLRKKGGDSEFFQKAFQWAALYALVGAVMVGLVGDAHGKFLAKTQPMKIAAAEAIWNTENPADFVLIASIDEEKWENPSAIRIPKALSFLLYNRFTGEVKGLDALYKEAEQKYGPGNYMPPVTITFWSFRIMVGVGVLMILLAFLALVSPRIKFLKKSRLFMQLLLPAMALPYIASTAGWVLTESARQPWIVYGLQKVQDAVSPNLTTGDVLFSLVVFIVLLGALVAVTGWLMYRAGSSEPQSEKAVE
jgi:cytochrome d ubiquinol oxidase subunit I